MHEGLWEERGVLGRALGRRLGDVLSTNSVVRCRVVSCGVAAGTDVAFIQGYFLLLPLKSESKAGKKSGVLIDVEHSRGYFDKSTSSATIPNPEPLLPRLYLYRAKAHADMISSLLPLPSPPPLPSLLLILLMFFGLHLSRVKAGAATDLHPLLILPIQTN